MAAKSIVSSFFIIDLMEGQISGEFSNNRRNLQNSQNSQDRSRSEQGVHLVRIRNSRQKRTQATTHRNMSRNGTGRWRAVTVLGRKTTQQWLKTGKSSKKRESCVTNQTKSDTALIKRLFYCSDENSIDEGSIESPDALVLRTYNQVASAGTSSTTVCDGAIISCSVHPSA